MMTNISTTGASMATTMTSDNESIVLNTFYEHSTIVTSSTPDKALTDAWPMESDFTANMTSGVFFETTTTDNNSEFSLDDVTQRFIIGSVICLVGVFGFIGNIMVILAVILSKKLQTRTNAFVVNLATADLLTCTASPLNSVALFSLSGWPLPESICSIVAALYFTCLACSIVTLAAIAINRFILITKPTARYISIYTPKKTAAMLVFTWLYPALVCSLPLFGLGRWGYSKKYKMCSLDNTQTYRYNKLFAVLGSALVYPIPLFILIVCYFKIYRHITSHTKKMLDHGIEMSVISTSASSELQAHRSASFSKMQVEITKNLFYVMCSFVALLGPFAIALMIPASDPVIPWTGVLIIFNSAVNPVIYGAKHPNFKEVFRHIFRCRFHMIPEPSSCLQKS